MKMMFSLISTPFFAASDVGVVREFVDAYQRTFGIEPDAYAAQGYDAASLLMQQLAAKHRDRASVAPARTDAPGPRDERYFARQASCCLVHVAAS